jgi:hypothetical protein
MDPSLARPLERYPLEMAETALRGTATLFDSQLQTWRRVLQMQLQGAAALGMPNCTPWLRLMEQRATPFADAAEQAVQAGRRAAGTLAEVHRGMASALAQRTADLGELDADERSRRAASEARRQAVEEPGWQQAVAQPQASAQPEGSGQQQGQYPRAADQRGRRAEAKAQR